MGRLSKLKDPRFVALAALGLVISLGFFIGRNLVLFLGITLVIALLVLGYVMWRMMIEVKAAKAGKGIQGDLDKQVEREIEKSTFGQDVVVRNVKAEWDAAMAEFRKSAVGRRLGDRALAQLPMYFVIGPEGAGKSALIQESGLSSVLRDAQGRAKAVRGVGGGRDFSWWFTEQAFLLDMSGRTMKRSQFDDTEDWVGFLKSLQKQRPERPINGVVVAVPVHDVAGAPKEKVDPLANTLRERIRDLGHHLGMEFPVYVVFTHCDRIAGFAETFEGFSDDQAAQPWGATVSYARSRETAAESLFDAEYAALVASLGTLRTARVHTLADEVQRLRALAFPAQVERLREDLGHFVGVLFKKDKGPAEGGILRGFYFTCSRVGVEVVDRVVGPVAEAASLPARLDAPTPQVAQRSWFAADLWRRIILRDYQLAAASEWARRRRQRQLWIQLGGLGGTYALLTLLFVLFAVNVAKPIRDAEAAGRALASLSEYEVARKALIPLDGMRSAVERLEANRAHKSFAMRLGAYAGDHVITSARELYVRRAEQHLLQPLAPGLRDDLARQVNDPATPFATLFYQYQVYRLLADPHAVVEPEDAVVLGKVLVRMLRPELERLAPDTVRAYVTLAREQAHFLANHGEPKPRLGTFDNALAARAIAALQQRWSEWPSLYDDMIVDANEAIAGLTVQQILKDAKRKQELFLDSEAVPGAFTRTGWETFVRPRLRIMRHVVQSEKDPQLSRELGDKVRQLTDSLGAQYADGYASAWVAFLGRLKGEPRGRGRSGLESLQREATFDSEILAIMKRTMQETELEGDPETVRSVAKRFGIFRAWLLPEQRKRDVFQNIKSRVPFLRSELDKTNHAAYQELLAKTYKAKEQDGERTGLKHTSYGRVINAVLEFTPPRGLEGDAKVRSAFECVLLVMGGATTVVDGDTTQPGTQPGTPLGGGDPKALRDDWSSKIVSTFNAQYAGKYPFANSPNEVKLADLASFLAPGGTLSQVYDLHFKGRMDDEGNPVNTQVNGTGRQMREWMARALAIQQAFKWSERGPELMMDVKTRADLLQPSSSLHSVTWIVGETSLFYEMGEPEIRPLIWEPKTAGQGASIGADVNGQPYEGPQFDGEWGLFRVLDMASLTPAAGGKVRATWRFGGVTMSVEITPRTSVHPFSSGFMRLDPPPALGQ